MLPSKWIDTIRKSGVSYAELAKTFKWSTNRIYSLTSGRCRLDKHEFEQLKSWIMIEEARQNGKIEFGRDRLPITGYLSEDYYRFGNSIKKKNGKLIIPNNKYFADKDNYA